MPLMHEGVEDLVLPGDAIRAVDLRTLVGWNAYAREQGRTAFSDQGVDVIDADHLMFAFAAYVIGEAPETGGFGLEGVPDDQWLLVAFLVRESEKGWRGRIAEVRAGAFAQQPLAEPPPNVMRALYEGAERYRAKREAQGIPLGRSLYGLTREDS